MSRKRKKITIKDLRKHIVNTRKVDGGKIHTISTPNAGPIEIVEGNSHSKGGVNYIKTSDGVTHEIENNEVVLPTDKGPYVVSDYMNVDGTKSYNKNKVSYADLVKRLALAGAKKEDLEAIAMQTEIQNGNDPNNPTSLIKDTNVMKQPKVNLDYKEPVKKYQQITDSQGNMLVPNRMSFPNDNIFQKAGRYVGNQYLKMTGQNDVYYKQPKEYYQQTTDRQSRSGKDNFWGNLFGPKRTEVNLGGGEVRLEDKGSSIIKNVLQYDIQDGDTTGVYQNLYTNQIGNRSGVTDGVAYDEETTDQIQYNIQDGNIVVTDKSGRVINNLLPGSLPNNPSIFNQQDNSNFQNIVQTNVTSSRMDFERYPEVSIHQVEDLNSGNMTYLLAQQGKTPTEAAVNSFRLWVNDNYPEYAKSAKLDPSGKYNDYVKRALAEYGEAYFNRVSTQDQTSSTNETVTQDKINELLLKEYRTPKGKLKRKKKLYQEPIKQFTNFEGDETTITSDYLFDYDPNLTPITDPDGTYGDYKMENWRHKKDKTPNIYPTQEEFNERGFQNVQEWRDWVNTQPGWEDYDWGNLGYWGPKHDEAWKGMQGPPEPVEVPDPPEDTPCVGPNCEESSFSAKMTDNKKKKKDGKKWNWGKIGLVGLGGLAAFGAYKAIAGQMGKTDDMLEAAKKEKPNLISKQQLGRVDLQRISNRSQMVDALMRGQSMDNSVEAMNIPEGAKYLLKERNTITTQRELNKIKEAENNVNIGIAAKEGGLNAQLAMKQGELNTKVDVANQLEKRDIREQKYAAWDRQVAGRQQLISDLIKLGGQGIEAYATLKSKRAPLTKDKTT